VVECVKHEAKPILPPPVEATPVIETKKIEPVEVKKEEILPVILQAPCTPPPPPPSVTPPSAPSTPTSSQDKESTTPASIKRKVRVKSHFFLLLQCTLLQLKKCIHVKSNSFFFIFF
jgi:hypothetical protein